MNMHSDDKNVFAMKQSEQETLVPDVCKTLGVPDRTFYGWKNKRNGMNTSETDNTLKLDTDNIKLNKIVESLTLNEALFSDELFTLNYDEPLHAAAIFGKIALVMNKHYLKAQIRSGMMVRILLVENDPKQRKTLSNNIERTGYRVFGARDANEALAILETVKINMAILAVVIPGMNGIELTRLLRDYDRYMPILVHTEKNDIQCKEAAFNAGADDYLVKPVEQYEIILRIKALLRRSQIISEREITIGSTILNRETWTVKTAYGKLILPKKEFEILFLLLSNPGRIFTRHQLMEEIWGVDCETEERTIDVHIKRVREKISRISEIRIITIRGVGYSAEKYELDNVL